MGPKHSFCADSSQTVLASQSLTPINIKKPAGREKEIQGNHKESNLGPPAFATIALTTEYYVYAYGGPV